MKHIITLLCTLLLLTACNTTQPIYNANSTAYTNINSVQMSKAIVEALHYKRWKVISQKNGEIKAGINVRSHYAEISINYDNERFKINYADSSNLDYKTNKIHRNYNKWIMLLEQEIDRNILLIK